ncbi:MAG: type VI secretion system tip protein VgrG, partial [Prevotella sp.]
MQNFSTLISVSIDGKRLFSFKSLELKQAINEHHTFTLTLDFEAAGSRYVHNLKDNAQWLGKNMTVHAGEKKQTVFLGIITNVSLHKQDSELGYLVIKGYSTTYLLENAPDFHSWNERTLESIVGELTKDAGVQAKIRPEHTAEVNYECQYNETDFDFIRRLAKQYGEWLYYDGKSLVFGKPDKEEPVRLEYGIDLYSLDIGLQTLARPLKVFSYHATDDNTLIENSPNRPEGQSLLGYKAFNASMEMFKTPSNQAAMPRIRYMKQLEAYTRKAQQSAAAETHYVEGTSSNALLKVGSVVRLRSSVIGDFGALSKENLGDFIITEITHSVSEGSYYRNRFKAIPSGTLTLPAPDVSMPIAGPQTATVVSNDDPKEAGHVRVQMNWQTGNMQTGWIRVMTPDAGSSDKVNTNRGFVFI